MGFGTQHGSLVRLPIRTYLVGPFLKHPSCSYSHSPPLGWFFTSSGPKRSKSAFAPSPFPSCKAANLQPVSVTLDVDNGYYTVKFDSLLLKETVVEGDSILPPLRTEAAESSDSDSGDASDSSYARGMAETISAQKPGWRGRRADW